jgi:predicted DNA-binding transcriptional regulator YafY
MNITKRFDRILQIFFLLQSRSVVTAEELTERFEISLRTVYRDLRALETAGVPIVNHPGNGYAIMEGFRLQPSRFSQEEVLSLMIADKIMQTHETQFIKRHFEAALVKIKSSFHVHQKNDLLDLEDKLHFNKHASARDYLPNIIDILLNSTLKKKIVNLQYEKSPDSEPTMRRVETVGVFYEHSSWYVMAYCHLRHDYRNFRLDRIKKVSLSDEGFTRVHLTVNELRKKDEPKTVTDIVIKIEQEYAGYIYWERQSFGFKHEEVSDRHMVMHFCCTLPPTYFVRWFMKFADVGEIVEPVYLQTQLVDLLTKSLQKANERRILKPSAQAY